MSTLIAKYLAKPTAANAAKIADYHRKHVMPDPRPPRGAFLRLALVAALAVLLVAPRLALADESEGVAFPCGPLDRAAESAHALGGHDFIALTSDQWQFLRGMFVQAPDTPESLPPGDRAMISMRPDGSASVVFVDGDLACAPIRLGKPGVEALMSVGRGDIVHVGQGL